MNKSEWDDWWATPAAEYLKKYLLDSAKEQSSLLVNLIVGGTVIDEKEQIQTAITCATLISIADIEFREIDGYYEEE